MLKQPLGKIIQLLPAPSGMTAVYRDDECPGDVMRSPVLCFALDGAGQIAAMDSDGEGGLCVCSQASNFLCVE